MQQSQYRAQRLAERRLPGIGVELDEYEWEPGAVIVHLEHEVVLRLRLRPDRLEAVGILEGNLTTTLGKLMVRPPNIEQLARAGAVREHVSIVTCRFDPAWLQAVVGEQDQWCLSEHPTNLDMHNGDLNRTMRRIAEEIASPSYCSDTLIDALASTAGVDLFRHRLSREGRRQIEDNGGLCPLRLKLVRDFVESSLEKAPTISAIANEIGISSSHLRRLFKTSTGQTLHDYIEEARVTQARDMLANTRLPLKIISYKVGFSHPSAFSAAFRKATGESPREYRERVDALAYSVH